MFEKKSNQEKTKKSARKKRDSKEKLVHREENDSNARRNMKFKRGATEEECVAEPIVKRAPDPERLRRVIKSTR